jgi:hypothetical protein
VFARFFKLLEGFYRSRSGAVTVDFIPLICAVIGLCFGVFSFLSATLQAPSTQVAVTLESMMDEHGFAPADTEEPEPTQAAPVQPSLPSIEPEQNGTQSAEPTGDGPQTLPVVSGSGGTSSSGSGGVPVVAIGVMPGSGSGGQGTSGSVGGSTEGDAAVFGSDASGSDPEAVPDATDVSPDAVNAAGNDGSDATAGAESQADKSGAFGAETDPKSAG